MLAQRPYQAPLHKAPAGAVKAAMAAPLPTDPAAVLDAEHGMLERFIALLVREQDALVAPVPDQLEAIALEKQALVDEMMALRSRRPAGKPGQLDQAPAHIAERLRRVGKAAAEAKRLNDTNTRLLSLHMQACISRIQVLRGCARMDNVYHANGRHPAIQGGNA